MSGVLESLFQAKPGLGITKAQDAGPVGQLEQKHLDIMFHSPNLASESEFLQFRHWGRGFRPTAMFDLWESDF